MGVFFTALLWITTLLTIYEFYKADERSLIMLAPYGMKFIDNADLEGIWVAFLEYLVISLW